MGRSRGGLTTKIHLAADACARPISRWPTNNISERGLRPAKTQQKIAGRLTSEDITQDRLDIRSYIDSARSAASTS